MESVAQRIMIAYDDDDQPIMICAHCLEPITDHEGNHGMTMTTDDLLDLIIDAADELNMQPTIDAQQMLDQWHIAKTATTDPLPDGFNISDAAQAAADILAAALKVSQFAIDAFLEMHTDEGLRLEQWSTVLWVEEPGTLVVWLGNLEDQDMTHLGRAKFSN